VLKYGIEIGNRNPNDDLTKILFRIFGAKTLDLREGILPPVLGDIPIIYVGVKPSAQIERQSPRWQLLEENQTVFVDNLKKFAGQKIVIIECGTMVTIAGETLHLERDLNRFLGTPGAGWNLGGRGYPMCSARGWGGRGGNVVLFNSSANNATKEAARALAAALNVLKIDTECCESLGSALGPTDPPAPDGADPQTVAARDRTSSVFILVGPRPQ
jgi:hypothetical protein